MTQSAGHDIGRRFVGSIDKAFRVLAVFNTTKRPLALAELARLSGVERSAAQRIALTLRELEYIRQDPSTRLYRLGARMLEFGQTYLRTNEINSVAETILEDANRRCGETLNLTVLEGTEVVYVLRYPSRHVVSVDLSLGSRLPAYCTAPGRAIMAFLPQAEAKLILERSTLKPLTAYTKFDADEIEGVLREVRRDGYCTSNQEAFIGDISSAAPVFASGGRVAAAVNIAVPTPRWSLTQVRRDLTPIVIDCAARISGILAGT